MIFRALPDHEKLPQQVGIANALTDQQDSRIRVEFEAAMWLQLLAAGDGQAVILAFRDNPGILKRE